ncbi:uncharacterized protein LOC120277761 [Dioscorea cayenensis subsp. rotundata]|uniref:Uncharacterized protein LOC120277761 n=1 Tax=Dioscorea cayennensis subsp. rotundata TaxID=55577 RepID=A0AB40CLV1_DIOCR|nr:uncharacterized protein LOC120277761 [Dioscorea cayenensis subsp. rotundata]
MKVGKKPVFKYLSSSLNSNKLVSELGPQIMAEDINNHVILSQPSVFVFKGHEYGRWSLRMKMVFWSQELWDLVEKGIYESKDEAVDRENKKKDAMALSIIQQAIDDPILDRIVEAETAHAAWVMIQKQYNGTTKIALVRKQSLRQNFEVLQMEENESIQDYCSRVVFIVNQIRGLGYKLSEEEVVAKVLRSLHPKFDFVVVAIKESKDITKLSLDELSRSLQAHEIRVNKGLAQVQTLEVFKEKAEVEEDIMVEIEEDQVEEANYWAREKQQEKEVNLVAEEKDINNVFMAINSQEGTNSSIWLIDSGCSNHMTEDRGLFSVLDESQKESVRLGDD